MESKAEATIPSHRANTAETEPQGGIETEKETIQPRERTASKPSVPYLSDCDDEDELSPGQLSTQPSHDSTVKFSQVVDVTVYDPDKSQMQLPAISGTIGSISETPNSNTAQTSHTTPSRGVPDESMPLPQGPVTQPKKRGRPRKNPLAGDTPPNNSSLSTGTLPRKRGRPPKSTKACIGANSPRLSDKKLMASVRHNSRQKSNLVRKLFPSTQLPGIASVNGNYTPSPSAHILTNPFAHVQPHAHAPDTSTQWSRHPVGGPSNNKATDSNGSIEDNTNGLAPPRLSMSPITAACSCNLVKALLKDTFFHNAVMHEDNWVVPHAVALTLHQVFGGGTPPPTGDLTVPSDKVEAIRKYLF